MGRAAAATSPEPSRAGLRGCTANRSRLRARLADLEERIGQRDRVDVARQLRVDHEHDRPLLRFARIEGVLLEAEALELVEVSRGLMGRVAGNGLGRHAAVLD